MSDNQDAILEIVSKAFQIEVDGYTFYSMTAERAQKEAVRELFAKLASDEVEHQGFLKSVARNYGTKGAQAFLLGAGLPRVDGVGSQILSGRFREQAAGAQFELAVLSIGMALETNAIKYFSTAAQQASDKEIKEFYQFLTNWESQHFNALQDLYTLVREDQMSANGFSPF